MKYRNVGKSGLRVSVVGLGCNNFGWGLDQAAAARVIDAAIDAGITLFDTADAYGGKGASEHCIGNTLGARRKDIVLATKFGSKMDEAGLLRGASRRYIMSAVEGSLKRLNTDWIDLYQLHNPDPLTPMEETLRALDDLIHQGKVRYVGCSNLTAWKVADAAWLARHFGLNGFVSCQDEYNVLSRKIEADLIPAATAYGAGILPYFPLASGVLTGKYKKGGAMPEGARLTLYKGAFFDKFLADAQLDRAEQLAAFAAERGHSLVELAFSWLAAQPAVPSIIAGATKPEQVIQNAEAADWEMTAEELAEIDRIAPIGGSAPIVSSHR
jgi:aryl-alcohol dehydrogenase-like predicted oxidoreductase